MDARTPGRAAPVRPDGASGPDGAGLRGVLHACAGLASPANAAAPLSDSDWRLLLRAVTCRLAAAAGDPAPLPAVVAECVDALEWLQAVQAPQRRDRANRR